MIRIEEIMVERVRPKGVYIPVHMHEYFEFVYFISGKGITAIGDAKEAFYSNTAILYLPGTLHDEIYEKTGTSIVLRFYIDNPGLIQENYILNDTNLTLYDLLQSILKESKTKKPHWKSLVNNYIFEILIFILRQKADKVRRIDNIESAISSINSHFASKLNIGELAKATGYSEEHFRFLFKKATGLSPKAYILNKRLEKAIQMLELDNVSLAVIADHCGFEYYNEFVGFFKKKTKLSPREYRKVLLEERGKRPQINSPNIDAVPYKPKDIK